MLWGNFGQKYDFRHFFALFSCFLEFFQKKEAQWGLLLDFLVNF